MNLSSLLEVLVVVGLWSVTAIVVGALVYFLLRESHSSQGDGNLTVPYIGSGAILLAFFLTDLHVALALFFNGCVLGVIGAVLHRQRGGASSGEGVAFINMAFAVVLANTLHLLLLSKNFPLAPPLTHLGVWWAWRNEIQGAFLFFLAVPVVLMPFVSLLWRNVRLRPGVDRSLSQEERDDGVALQ